VQIKINYVRMQHKLEKTLEYASCNLILFVFMEHQQWKKKKEKMQFV